MTNHRGINFCVFLSFSVSNLSRLSLLTDENWFLLRLLRLTNVLFQIGRYKSKFVLHRIFILCWLNWTKYLKIRVGSRTAWCGRLRNVPCWKLCMWQIVVTWELFLHETAEDVFICFITPFLLFQTILGWPNRMDVYFLIAMKIA